MIHSVAIYGRGGHSQHTGCSSMSTIKVKDSERIEALLKELEKYGGVVAIQENPTELANDVILKVKIPYKTIVIRDIKNGR